jgi:endonuclease/exonuclease/phosphatase family metal-dependent hydrolase
VDEHAAPGPRTARGGPRPLRDLNSLVPDRRADTLADPRASREPGELRVLSWNVFHGRDFPPARTLRRKRRLRSRLLRATVHDDTHVQVNRSLFEEFATLLAGSRWDVCLLQECPPRWAERLGDECRASVFRALTSRNWLAPARNVVAEYSPDLLGSWEGGSNVTLVRPPWQIVETKSVLLNPWRERRLRERRRLALARIRDGDHEVCVGNLHLSASAPQQAAREARRAARITLDFAGGAPVVLGGDFNVRPVSTGLFKELCEELGLCGMAGRDAIDHILSRDLEVVEPPTPWTPEQRELDVLAGLERRRLRLSDHAPVEARFIVR